MKNLLRLSLASIFLASGCTTYGKLGIVAKSSMDSAQLLKQGRPFKELGPAQGRTCRYNLFNLLPWGDASVSTAADRALAPATGDALVDASVASSYYSFLPIFNVFAFACTEVNGTAVRFE